MTGKASRVTLWPSAAQVLGALLDRYVASGKAQCFEIDCENESDCDAERASRCKFAKQLQLVIARLYKAGYPENPCKFHGQDCMPKKEQNHKNQAVRRLRRVQRTRPES